MGIPVPFFLDGRKLPIDGAPNSPVQGRFGQPAAWRATARIFGREGMSRIVWGRATSSNVMKVLWGLGELGVPFERIDIGGAFSKSDTPERLRTAGCGLHSARR
jgi:hypothetical protein